MSSRADRLVAGLEEASLDLVLVTDLVNVRYLTGYTGTNGLAVVGPGTRVFVTDFRYVEQAAEEVDPGFQQVRAAQELTESIADFLPSGRLRVGFDDVHTSVRDHRRLCELLEERVKLVPAGGLVEGLRRVKEPGEVELIAAATTIADTAFETLIAGGLIGRTERALVLELETEMRRLGADGASFDTIIAGGGHGALPHASPRDVPIIAGELVVIDWGARWRGYCSDCTRPARPTTRLVRPTTWC